MTSKPKILHVALARQHYDLAAHVILYGLLKAKVKEKQKNGEKRSPARQSKRP